jgi:hAT family C-terminal dimerisation region
MTERFVQIRSVNESFSFLWGERLNSFTREDLEKHAKDLSAEYPSDLHTVAFISEITSLKSSLEPFLETNVKIKDLDPLAILNVLYQNNMESGFPNVEVALRIFLTLPVTVATNERVFSKLKIIKTYLRSSMGQERLCNLAIISIEQDILNEISFDDIIGEFANSKCRRVKLN